MKTTWTFLLACCALAIGGCRVSKPGAMETKMATEVKHKMTVGGKNIANPVSATAESIADGQEHFGHHCAICHGLDGQATGVPFAEKMSPPVPSLNSTDVQEYKDGQLKWIIENGINPSGMPSWKGILSNEEMWKIVNFMRHLPAKGSLGVPAVYQEEQEEHQHAHHDHHSR
ncbi:MAG: c-type cytochrome [Acidobacteriota bacterium]|nr:c-type cytochrome [Acidobacteriota bacterium]